MSDASLSKLDEACSSKPDDVGKKSWRSHAKSLLGVGDKAQSRKPIWKPTWAPTFANLQEEFHKKMPTFATNSTNARIPRFKIVVVGSAGRKQTYMLQFIIKTELKPEIYHSTVFPMGLDLTYRRIGGIPLTIGFNDLTGQEDYDRLRPLGYVNASVVLICCTTRSTTEQDHVRERWLPEIQHFCPKTPIILVGMEPGEDDSVDMDDVIASQRAAHLARDISAMAHVSCNPETGKNLREVLEAASMAALLNTSLKKRLPWQTTTVPARLAVPPTEPSTLSVPSSKLTWNSVCAQCAALFDVRTIESTVVHHQRWQDLQKSASGNCYICVRLQSYLERDLAQGFLPLSCDIAQGAFTTLTFSVAKYERRRSSYHFIALKDTESSSILPSEDLRNSTSSEGSVAQAKLWLENCLKHHEICSSAPHSAFLPTRLVSINRTGPHWSDLTASLRDGASLPANTKYLTLSHCWGTATFMTLTRDTIDQFRTSIPLSDPWFNRCFLDALRFAFSLGYRHIWIDSLCIIQKMPNDEDWKLEFPRMGEVYRNAVCNLAATAFKDGKHGMFVKRNGLAMMPAKVIFETIIPMDKHYFVVENEDWSQRVELAPLFQRAWVIPEQILSPRTIHFGEQQIFWECHNMFCCEMWPDRFPDALDKTLKNRTAIAGPSQLPQLTQWSAVVQAYSKTYLSNPDDKFPAISGVAKVFQSQWKDRYIAGLWESNLHLYLLWIVQLSATNTKILTCNRAPTWSWASLDVGVAFPLTDGGKGKYNPLCDIIEAAVKPSTIDETGPLTGGFLRVRGRLRRLHFHDIKLQYGAQAYITNYMFPPATKSVFRLSISLDRPAAYYETAPLLRGRLSNPKLIYLMPIVEAPRTTYGIEPSKVDVYYLILVPDETERGFCRRIGVAVAYDKDSELHQKIFYGPDPAVEEDFEDNCYTITIL